MRFPGYSTLLQLSAFSPASAFLFPSASSSSVSRLWLTTSPTTITASTLLRMVSSSASPPSSDASTSKNTMVEEYLPPTVWTPDAPMGGKFGGINQPTAGAREERELPRGKHPLQLYSMGTPNGQKVTILLEELLEVGHEGAEYDAYFIDIMAGDQFTSGFVDLNPNSKIPALLDTTTNTRMFESGSILLQLSDKFDHAFVPQEARSEVMNWLFWQMGSAPYLGGGFGHFFSYAPSKMKYPIDRFTMETKRQLDVLEQQLAKPDHKFIVGDDYTLADIAIYPWYGLLALGQLYEGSDIFLNVAQDYPNVVRWAKDVKARPAVQRGSIVNKTWGTVSLKERHAASDFDNITNEAEDPEVSESKL